ncbi:MAG TPA: hypothetical protein VHO95_10260, partial [Candidatus Dormibacteraeota bacterium]|nr:hypothetical protein [Candidatus Dormibacteraeota bacterium]
RTSARGAASLVIALALLLLIVAGGSLTGLIVSEAQQLVGTVTRSPAFTQLSELRIGRVNVGAQLADLAGC